VIQDTHINTVRSKSISQSCGASTRSKLIQSSYSFMLFKLHACKQKHTHTHSWKYIQGKSIKLPLYSQIRFTQTNRKILIMSCGFVYFTSLSCGVVSLEQGKNEKKEAVLEHKPEIT